MPLDDPDNKQTTRSGGIRLYAGVLAECRNLLEARAAPALIRTLVAVDDALQARREQSPDALEQSLALLQLQSQLGGLREEQVGRAFRAGFAKAFDARTRSEPAQRVIYGETANLSELTLVDDEQVSEELALQNLAKRLHGACRAEMADLEARAALMLGRDELEPSANPLGPTAVCEALHALCQGLEDSNEARKDFLELLVDHFGPELAAIYHEINELLVARRILPLGRPWVRRQPPQRRPAPRPDSGERRQGIADVLEHLHSPRAEGAPARLPNLPSPAGSELMAMLTRVQMGETSVALGEDAFSLEGAAGGTTNVINALLDAGLGKHLGAIDGIVIDVVATLFDYIFDDDRVPDAMKGLIGRLQIPVLKLALLDHSFFSSRSQPARRLISTLAQAAITWDGEFTTETPLYQRADAIVRRIQAEFTENPEVFAACLAELERYLGEQERLADERAAALTARLEERERHNLARDLAQRVAAARAATPNLPASVYTFLTAAWTKVLAQAALEGGEEGPRWRDACTTMDELVWSVLPKADALARKQLVERLPALLKGLRAGAEQGQIEAGVRDAFLTELVKLHAAAVKAGMQPAAPAEAAPVTVPPLPAGSFARPVVPEEPPQESFEVDLLRRGDWVELTDESGSVRRVRLTWISPARTMYLFANRQGQRALALTRDELTRRFAQREAVAASEEALMDRLVDDVFENYQSLEERQR